MEQNFLNNEQDMQFIDGQQISLEDIGKRVVYRDEARLISGEGTIKAWSRAGIFVLFTLPNGTLSVNLCPSDKLHFV